MTPEQAQYYLLMLRMGEYDEYDAFLDRLTEQELKTMLDRAMAQDDPHQVDHLKALANENGILAGELLRM